MTRRDLIALLGSIAAAWPVAVRAQQSERMRRIGVLMNVAESDAEGQDRLRKFTGRLSELGWIDGRNLHIAVRWAAGDVEGYRRYASELAALAPRRPYQLPRGPDGSHSWLT